MYDEQSDLGVTPPLSAQLKRYPVQHIITSCAEGSEVMILLPFVLQPDRHEPALNVVGTQVTVLASNEAMQSYGITLQEGKL